MLQFQVSYTDRIDFDERLAAMAGERYEQALFHIFCDRWGDELVKEIHRSILIRFPDAVIAGASSFGNIVSGTFRAGGIVVTGTLFEKASTQIEALYYPLASGEAGAVGRALVAEVAKRPWVKAVEVLVMNNAEPVDDLRAALDDLPEDVEVFGGCSFYGHEPDLQKFIVDGDGACMRWGAAFVLYGGDDLHFMMRAVGGWQPLGVEVAVTSHTGNIVHEVNGRPAIEMYSRYLGVEGDANFYYNAIDFPFLFEDGESSIVRTPYRCLDDGSLVLASTFPENGRFKMSYGDPEEMLRHARACGEEVTRFKPDGIMLVSSAARRTFWSDQGSNRETVAFNSVAPTAGYFAAGEFLRINGKVVEHNSTLLVIALREGSPAGKPETFFAAPEERRKKSLVARFAKLVNVTMADFNDLYEQLNAEK